MRLSSGAAKCFFGRDKGLTVMKELDQSKIQQLKAAFLRAIDLAGNVHRLHLKTNVSEASLNRYRSGRQNIVNAPFFTLLQLFPEMEVQYFKPAPKPENDTMLEDRVVKMFRALNHEEQINCLALIAAQFPDRVKSAIKKPESKK